MSMGYLDGLNLLLATGMAEIAPAFLARQAAFLADRQHADGGFAGRQGASDPYYTDFAVRTLALIDPRSPALAGAARYLAGLTDPPASTVDCFSRLHAASLVRQQGHDVPLNRTSFLNALAWLYSPKITLNAYDIFLGCLCCELLEIDLPPAGSVLGVLNMLRCPDGGFRTQPGDNEGQTSATAAATAMSVMLNDTSFARDAAARFLAGMQSVEGGLLAHRNVQAPDLLSTFTGLLTLFNLDGMHLLNVPALARFTGSLAGPHGGFRATSDDAEYDPEYTYYGLGTLALLRAYAKIMQTG